MRVFWNVMGGLLAVGWAIVAADYFIGARKGRTLKEEPPYPEGSEEAPSLSVVIAACNEEEKLPAAFRTLLAQEYPGSLELIAVDDRSTDRTPQLVDELAAEGNAQGCRVVVLHIPSLPSGWLGKNHALYQGSAHATGAYLLFADADIHFAPDTLSRAVHLMEREKLDHLAAFPELYLRGFGEMLFGLTFSYFFFLKFRPWHVRNPKRKEFLGVGAFNMVRRSSYEQIGSHRVIALEVADDMELGHRMKEAGFACDVVGAADFIGVRWQEGLSGLLNGLVKNAYSGFHFSPLEVASGLSQMIAGIFLPLVGMVVATDRRAKLGYGFASLALIAGGVNHARAGKIPVGYAFLLPASAALLFYVTVRSMLVTERNGGVTWRNTFYPLEQLRSRAIPPPPPLISPAPPS